MYLKLYVTLVITFVLGVPVLKAAQILALCVNDYRSHLLVYSSVINVLASRGHNVTIVTTLDVKDIGLSKENVRWIKLSANFTKTLITSNANGLAKIENMLKRIEETSYFLNDPLWQNFLKETHQYDLLIIGYLFNDYQLGLAAHYNCPVVVIWTGQPIGFIHSLMGNPEERCKHFPGSQYPSFSEMRKSVSLALCNHHSMSEGPIAPYLPGIIEIGGLENKPSLENNKEFNLLKEEGLLKLNVIYFSFGSRVKWSLLPNSLELMFIEAFKAFPDYTILWTYDKNCTELELQFPSSNIKCKSWWPQSSVLALDNTKLFITHCGKGSISEALSYGKPILGVPLFGDQRVNVAKIEERKFGLKLPIDSITVDNLVKTLRELLENDLYRSKVKIFSKLYRDRPVSSEDSVAYWLEYVIRYKGTKHLRSPALDLNFIQYYLIDVYLLILFSFTIIIIICNCLEKKIL